MGGEVVIDQAVDVLWPDADLVVGRRRLRNVLGRIRDACGDVIDRSGDAISLASHVRADYLTARSMRREATDFAELTAALVASDRLLLPADRYEEWAEQARSELAQEVALLLDRHATMATAAGQQDTAIASMQRAVELDGSDASRDRRLANLLAERP